MTHCGRTECGRSLSCAQELNTFIRVIAMETYQCRRHREYTAVQSISEGTMSFQPTISKTCGIFVLPSSTGRPQQPGSSSRRATHCLRDVRWHRLNWAVDRCAPCSRGRIHKGTLSVVLDGFQEKLAARNGTVRSRILGCRMSCLRQRYAAEMTRSAHIGESGEQKRTAALRERAEHKVVWEEL